MKHRFPQPVLFACGMLAWAKLSAAQTPPETASTEAAPAAQTQFSTTSSTQSVPLLSPAAEPVPAPPPPEGVAAAPAVEEEKHWYDNFKYEAFVDAYASINYNVPKPQAPGAAAGSAIGGNQFRAYDATNGFALHWFGLDLSHAPDPVGGGVNLRFGPSASLFNAASFGGTDSANGLQYIKNAYVSWRPAGKDGPVTLTMGKFNQPFGSELPESQYNPNYTRSLLYWYAQPLFMTGLKLDWALSEQLTLSLFAVNGWNNSIDNNFGKTGAIQFAYAASEKFTAFAGYSVGPEQTDHGPQCAAGTSYNPATGACMVDPSAAANGPIVHDSEANSRLRHFVDLVLDIKPVKELRILVNADYGTEKMAPGGANSSVEWYGANVAFWYAVSQKFALALRGEYYKDPQGFSTLTNKDTTLVNGTLTFAVTPTPNLIIKLDNRIDSANEEFFQRALRGSATTQVTSTLGVVATTGM